MHPSTAVAAASAQTRRRRTPSGYQQDLYDLALDELLRQPDRDGDPEHLLGNALANARKHQRRRAKIAVITFYGDTQDLDVVVDDARRLRPGPGSRAAQSNRHESAAPLADALDWIQRAPLTAAERTTLKIAAVAAMTQNDGDTTPTVRQRLARARASARAARVGMAW